MVVPVRVVLEVVGYVVIWCVVGLFLVMEMGAFRLGVGREVGNAAGFGSLVALWLLEEKSEETAVVMLERFGAAGI